MLDCNKIVGESVPPLSPVPSDAILVDVAIGDVVLADVKLDIAVDHDVVVFILLTHLNL